MERLEPAGRALTGLHVTADNCVVPLADGDEAYPRMLAAIREAKDTIWLCTYIFDTSETGRTFVQALADATARGVKVRVLVDGFGERLTKAPTASRLLKDAGVDARRFLPLRLFPPNPLFNLRNHRKLLWVDGNLAFVGGMNIGERHLRAGLGDPTGGTEDIQFEIRGSVVGQLAAAFVKDWKLATGEVLEATGASSACGVMYCRCITDGPGDDLDKLTLVYAAAIAAARSSVRIMTPYFIPPESIRVALQAAAIRGVEVDIILPKRSNIRVVDWASRVHQRDLVRRNVRVWLAPAPFNHGKLLVVDRQFALIGSANLDPRSLSLNFELGLEVYDDHLASDLAERIDARREQATRVRAEDFDNQSFPVRIRNALAWLTSPYL
ncbi:MAG: cardiolipin synthase [Bradymonadia bacterium]|jgi:cardiolipin synthase